MNPSKTTSSRVALLPGLAVIFSISTGVAFASSFTSGNIAVLQAAASANNSTCSVVEVSPSSVTPLTPVQTIAIAGTGTDAFRISGSATSTGFLSNSNDGSLVCLNGVNNIDTSSNVNTLNPRAVGILNQSGTFSLATTYTGASGNQTRSATSLNNSTWFISDQGGIYSNGTSGASPSANTRGIKSFGGAVYVLQQANTVVSAVSAATGGAITGLPGLPTIAAAQDFHFISSGENGTLFDVLYIVSSTNATTGSIAKYSLVSGSWTSNGSYATNFGGFGLAAADNGTGALLFTTTGTGANVANSLIKLSDNTGYNGIISITTANNVTLYTTPAGTNLKGVAFAPVAVPPPAGTVSISGASITEGNSGTSILSLTVTRTNIAAAFTVNYAVTGGTATSGSDYAAVTPGTLNFAAGGAASQNINIIVNGDTTIESNETVALTLSGIVDAVGVTAFGTTTASGTITNDDSVASSFPATGGLTSTLKGNIALAGAEIPAFDPISKRGFTSSNTGVQVVDLTNPSLPVFLINIAPSSLGVSGLTSDDVSSIAVRKGAGANPSVLAAAIIANPKTNAGTVLFLNAATGSLIGSSTVGVVPDHIAFTPDGTKLLVCNEGELSTPETTIALAVPDAAQGTVSIIPVNAAGVPAAVQTADFAAFDAQTASLKAAGVRIFDDGVPSTDFEPEYLAISADGTKAMVTLQEANAVATLDIATATFTSVVPLGKNDFSSGRHDFSDRDGAGASNLVNPTTGSPVFGLYMPDAIASYSAGGQTYYVTANEGDDRNDFVAPDETTTVGNAGYDLDDTVFPNELALKNQASLGRLTVSNAPGLRGDTDGDGDIDEILSYGGRSFSILNSAGAIIFDSGDMIENIIASQFFSNFDDGRSDNKGPEPEGVTIAVIGGRTYAFVGLERSHMALAFDVTNPLAVTFTGGFRRTGDLNPEGLVVVSAADSPTGYPLLLVANEVSNTLTIHEIINDPFATWLGYSGYTSTGIDQDTDGDGLKDRLEYFFNQNPNNGSSFGNMPQLFPNGGALELDFTRLTETGSTIGTLEISCDLASWTDALLGIDYTVLSSTVNGPETSFTYALPGSGPAAPGTSATYLAPNPAKPIGASLGGVRVVNQGLVGTGRLSGESLDSFGETQGAASGLAITDWAWNGSQFSGKFQVLPDRGYNSGAIFSNYAARLHRVDFTFTPYYGAGPVAQNQIVPTYVSTTKFTYQDGATTKFTTGLNPGTGTGTLFGQTVGVATGANGPNGTQESLLAFDAEAVHLFPDGSGFVSDEYGAYIARFNAAKQITGLTQLPEAARPHKGTGNPLVFDAVAAPTNGRRNNQGLEGLSVTPDGTLMFALLQSATVQDTNGNNQQTRTNARLFVYNVEGTNRETPVLIGEYIVKLPQIDLDPNIAPSALDGTAAQSEIVALGPNSFLMLPRDGNGMGKGTTVPITFKSVQLVDFASATNILGFKDGVGEQISPNGNLINGVNAAATAEVINLLDTVQLAKFGFNINTNPANSNTLNEKLEGMALVPDLSTPQANDFFLFIANDNDFQSSNVKMIDAAGNLVSYGDGRLNSGITNDAIYYAFRITIDAGGKKFFRFGVK